MRRVCLLMAIAMTVAGALIAVSPAPVGAAANGWPHSVVNGFSTPSGNGYWLVYADGTVSPHGGAASFGDASSIPLNGPIVGGAVTPNGKGYWLVAQDGGIFTFGDAHFYGSMGATHLNQPVFSMSPTKSGHGYWLVARDGGIFTFGDAKFYGSTGSLVLNEPITGITTSPTGKGYRMVATDGGIFSFGDVPFYGSLPGLGINVNDVIGNAPIPTNTGYWIARGTGQVYSFGHAQPLGSYPAVACNPIAAIFSNPHAQGYRLVTESGATIPFGAAPGGSQPTGNPRFCPTRIQHHPGRILLRAGGQPGRRGWSSDLADQHRRQRDPNLQVGRRGRLRSERERHVPQRPRDLESAVRAYLARRGRYSAREVWRVHEFPSRPGGSYRGRRPPGLPRGSSRGARRPVPAEVGTHRYSVRRRSSSHGSRDRVHAAPRDQPE
jgi:hypothetical protein